MQRALLQSFKPENRALVLEALKKAGRSDLIGFGPGCLIRPDQTVTAGKKTEKTGGKRGYGARKPQKKRKR